MLALAAAAAADPPATYVVKAGDTLIDIDRRYLVPAPWQSAAWRAVQKLNRVRDPYHMRVGLTLKVPRELLRFEPIGARIVAFRGPVMINGAPAVVNASIHEGMAITTGINGSITVECTDGSRFSLPSQSAVNVGRLRRVLINGDLDRRFMLQQGRSEWHAPHAPTPNSKFMVTTPVSVSAVRGTGFRVAYVGEGNNRAASTGVVDGVVGVSDSAQSRTESVMKGSGIPVGAAGVGSLVPLLAAPALDHPGAVQSKPELAFRTASAVSGASGYVFELGTDAGLIDRFAETRTVDSEAQFKGLPDGRYYVRMTAADQNGIDGLARTYSFERLSFSGEASQVDLGAYRFRWTGGGGEHSSYRFSLATDQAMTNPMIDRDGLALSQITITDLKPGTYWWRVTVTRFEDGRAVTAVNDPQSLTIAPRG